MGRPKEGIMNCASMGNDAAASSAGRQMLVKLIVVVHARCNYKHIRPPHNRV